MYNVKTARNGKSAILFKSSTKKYRTGNLIPIKQMPQHVVGYVKRIELREGIHKLQPQKVRPHLRNNKAQPFNSNPSLYIINAVSIWKAPDKKGSSKIGNLHARKNLPVIRCDLTTSKDG